MAEIITISIPTESKKLIEAIMKAKPDGTSFSKATRMIIEEYFRNKSSPILPSIDILTTTSTMDEWRKQIKSGLSGLSITYDYSPAGSLFDSAAEDFSKKLVNFIYQKYASIKMFKFMVNALKANENMFVDSAAFASGLTGYSPTFFKAKSNKSGAKATIETFEGSGGLELVGNKIKIKDTNTNAGILFTFDAKNNVMGKAKVEMNIRFNGSTQATLELLSVKW